MPATSKRKSPKNAKSTLRFDQRLVLNQWMLSLFHTESFEQLVQYIKDRPEMEGFTEDNQTRFYHELTNMLWESKHLSNDDLLLYDENIVRHWKQITAHRNAAGHDLYPKYFQYFGLLFTEIYLDRYFTHPGKLLDDLNHHVQEWNKDKPAADQVNGYIIDDLRKLAFWQATGSGKTLIMHVNILQYKHYLRHHNKDRDLNRIILLTPNEGLSKQHLDEFELSGMKAELFQKEQRPLFVSLDKLIEIIDINKLRETEGDKTVAVEAFEGNNLVLVDEGHRGSSGIEWKNRRDQLCENGFSMEYSATFGQAMKAANKKELTQEYAKCILFDYSYKYFYKDGYGKDFDIFNYNDELADDKIRHHYLIAALLAFYQQKKVYQEKKIELIPFLIESPLWVFVGSSVIKTGKQDISDVVEILLFLAKFVNQENDSKKFIEHVLKRESGIIDTKGNDIFINTFNYLISTKLIADEIYQDVLKVVFNANSKGMLHIENLKGADGEIALRIGDAGEFGLINVGDAQGLCKILDDQKYNKDFVVTDRDFSGSMFGDLSNPESKINILIGSRKFMEGWNSWRVSSMGLMNIGKKEGSMIIQLFGRGVRLKGFEFCLKRSKEAPIAYKPEHIEIVENLNIFGVRAEYMQQFKQMLEDEGVKTNDEMIKACIPVLNNLNGKKLKVPKVKDGIDFKKNKDAPNPALGTMENDKVHVILNWYPKVEAHSSHIKRNVDAILEEGKFEDHHLAFMDMNHIYFEMQNFKNEKSWYNLNLNRDEIAQLLKKPNWYTLYIPKHEMKLDSFHNIHRLQEVAIALLKRYCEKYYFYKKSEYESPHLEYQYITEVDTNFFKEYHLLIDQSLHSIVETLTTIKEMIKFGQLRDIPFQNIFKSIVFDQHLYQPLLFASKDNQSLIQIKPVVLNESEKQFIEDLKTYYEQKKDDFFKDKEFYLLRNRSRGKGIGFFEAGNFYPDFILWLLIDDKQYITFVDPHGIRMAKGKSDDKLRFYQIIKEIEKRMGDPLVVMNSFIVSPTKFNDIKFWDVPKEEFERCHVLFQEDKATYINKLMQKIK